MNKRLKKSIFTSTFALLGLLAVQTTQAQSGNALSLNGTSQYMKVASATDLNVTGSNSLTITFKVKHTVVASNARYFAKRSSVSGINQTNPGMNGTGYEAFYNAGSVGPNAKSTGGANIGGGFNTVTTMNDGAWHHVAMVFDNTDPAKYVTRLSVDGTMTNSGEASSVDLSNLVEFVVGAASDYSNKLAGTLDDIRVYNKAFNAADITADKNTLNVNGATPNLVAAWDFEGVVGTDVPDASGKGHNGTLVGTPTILPNFGMALSLNGSSQYMKVLDEAALNITNGQSLTLTLWTKIPTSGGNNNSYLFSKMNSNTTGYEVFVGQTSADNIAGNVRTTQTSGTNIGVTSFPNPSAALNTDTWRHVAAVVTMVEGVKSMQLYVDGNPFGNASNVPTGASVTNTMALLFGAKSNTSPSNFFKGFIDEIHVWNKAMTQVEVQTDKNTFITGAKTDLIAAWNFENVTGTTVPDVSGNSRQGTLVGNPALIDVNSNNMQYVTTTLIQTQIPSAKGLNDQRVIAVKVNVAGSDNPLNLTALNFTMNGTTNLADVSNIKVYYTGNNQRLNTSNLFATVTPAAGALVANGTQTLASGDNYFFITYDVNANAQEGNILDATCESVTVGGGVKTISSNNPAGNRVILLENTLVWKPGDDGAVSYRIPAVITAKDGSLIAAIDKRINNSGDLPGNIDIAIKRSTDNGRTWASALVIADLGNIGASDPALVLDNASGKLICLFATNNGLWGSTPSNPIRIRMSTSMDNGLTWSAVTDITSQIYGDDCTNPITKTWNAAWIASGRAHQMRNGRIAAAVGVRQTSGNQIDNFMIYSDDAGVTWQASTGVAELGGDEAKVVELNSGELLMSIRNPGTRRFNKSSDQGMTWGTPYNQTDIIDPNCDGDIIRYTSTIDGYNKNRLLHSIPFAGGRTNVSVLLSTDEGSSWPVRKTIFSGSSAYSSLTILPDGTIGIFYENGENGAVFDMYFTRFSLNWLTDGADTYTPSILPLKLVDFGANYNKASKQIKTTWQTQSEVNVNRFEVEYANDAINFTKAGTVNAKGNNLNGLHSYNFNFQTQQTGLIYLRLKMIDNDGTVSYSIVKTIVVDANTGFKISPNPVKNILNIQTTVSGEAELAIVNSMGKTVKKIQLNKGVSSVDVSSLTKGAYIAQLSVNGQTIIEKFIKE